MDFPQRSRSGSFQLPMVHDSPRDYSDSSIFSSVEYMQSTPPPNGSLLEFLRERRSPEIEPRGATATETHYGERDDTTTAPMDDDDGGRPRPSRMRSLRTTSDKKQVDKTRSTVHALDNELHRISVSAQSQASSTPTSASGETDTFPAAETEVEPTPPRGVKRSRYLREADRRDIIRRIDTGEKQAALAKEFGVTRAAICHINKNRREILTRAARADVHSAARHPKRGMYSTSKSTVFYHGAAGESHGELPMAYEVRSSALAILLTMLRRKETDSRTYRATADRAFRVLMEEALACAPTRAVENVAANDVVCQGLVAESPTCAIVMSECGYPMLETFRCIQPESSTGFMTLEHEDSEDMSNTGSIPRVTLRKMCAPPDLRGHSIFLLDATCASGQEAVVAIQSLLDFGARESALFFVTLVIIPSAIVEIAQRFPSVHVVTAAIDAEASGTSSDAGAAFRPSIGNFQERYFNTTTIRQNHFGANVQL